LNSVQNLTATGCNTRVMPYWKRKKQIPHSLAKTRVSEG
jgi:hypothetical protein